MLIGGYIFKHRAETTVAEWALMARQMFRTLLKTSGSFAFHLFLASLTHLRSFIRPMQVLSQRMRLRTCGRR